MIKRTTRQLNHLSGQPIRKDKQFYDELFDMPSSFKGSADEELKENGIYYIVGRIDEGSLLDLHQDVILKHLDPEWKNDVQILINSVGGSASEGWALIDLLRWVKMDIKTVALGTVCSMGSMLLAAGSKGKRAATENASIMVHGVSMEMGGNEQQIASSTKELNDEVEREIEFWIQCSKYKTAKEIREQFLDGRDKWYTAKEALHHGIIDTIIPQRNSNLTQSVSKVKKSVRK